MRRLLVVAVSIGVISCGGSNTPLIVAGRTLNPESADMIQLYGLPYVLVSDVQDYCGKLKASIPPSGCNVTSTSSSTGSPFGSMTGSFLAIGAYGASDGARLN